MAVAPGAVCHQIFIPAMPDASNYCSARSSCWRRRFGALTSSARIALRPRRSSPQSLNCSDWRAARSSRSSSKIRSPSRARSGCGVDCRCCARQIIAVDDAPPAGVSRIDPHILAVACCPEDRLLLSSVRAPRPFAVAREKERLVSNGRNDARSASRGPGEMDVELTMRPPRRVKGKAGIRFGLRSEPQWPRPRLAAATEVDCRPMAASEGDLRRCRSGGCPHGDRKSDARQSAAAR